MKKMMKSFIAITMCFSMVGCTKTQSTPDVDPITVVDQSGREITLEKPATKVASGYYIATTTLIGLGAEDLLTGVEMKAETRPIYQKAAPQLLELPALGNKKMFNVEECAKAQPDVVFLPISLNSYVDSLAQLGIQTILLNPETQDGYEEAVEIIAKVVGKEEVAKRYFDYCDYLEDTYLDFESEREPSVYMAGQDLLETSGKNMYQAEVIDDGHGNHIFDGGESKGWQTVNIETLISLNPEYIFLENGGVSKEAVLENDSLNQIQAKVYEFPSILETWDTPNLSSCLGSLWVASILHPDKVDSASVIKEAQTFYKQFYDIEVTSEDLGL